MKDLPGGISRDQARALRAVLVAALRDGGHFAALPAVDAVLQSPELLTAGEAAEALRALGVANAYPLKLRRLRWDGMPVTAFQVGANGEIDREVSAPVALVTVHATGFRVCSF